MPFEESLASLAASLLRIPLGDDLRAYGSKELNVVFVEARTDAGRVGTGFTYTFDAGAAAVRSMVVDVIDPLVCGSRVAAWDDVYTGLRAKTRRLGRHAFAPAFSAVDIAVRDLAAICAGMPLFEFFGGTSHPIPIYGSGRSANSLSVDELVRRSESYVDEGYTAIKLRVGARPPEEDAARVAAVRKALGAGVRLMVDCNERLDPRSALELATHLADLDIAWMEEPLLAEDVADYRALAASSPVPIATGEHLVGRDEFALYTFEHAVHVLQPDAALTGGLQETLDICELAVHDGLRVSLHSLPELHVHLAAASSAVDYVEHFPILDSIIAEPLAPSQGYVAPPQRAGHGIVWDREAIGRYTLT